MKKLFLIILLIVLYSGVVVGQTKKVDTVVVELAKKSKLVLTIGDKADIPTLKTYDYAALFADIIRKLEAKDTTIKPITEPLQSKTESEPEWPAFDNNDNDVSKWEFSGRESKRRFVGRNTWQSFNIDFGTNNFLNNGSFPDKDNQPYAVRPWGSWYIGLNSIQKTRIAGKLFLEWGFGVSWYNFKFQNDGTTLTKGNASVEFAELSTDLNPVKSKLTVTYLNASLVPVLDFGSNNKKVRFWDTDQAFRIGVGPYVGYRIDSYAKNVYKENGDKERDRNRSNFYLNNLRYGARLQVGYRGTDLFFNYDFNELFANNRGPSLNAFSFGIIF
ncbi:MAG: hypothetical protein O9302_12370 [Cyclobacteriaceae bacterium]|jgi:hypothetical protein|nr:hypothetical protein [Flammeovirgaceae bacterium]MCZ8022652.1 hypothetical protein [Cytophagales bacterium]MCZ8328851.1 hypothetical protein [Cyclobacteriaceae bacterium]